MYNYCSYVRKYCSYWNFLLKQKNLVFHPDYECNKSSSSNGLLWISFIYFSIIYFELFGIVRRASKQIYTRYELHFLRCVYY